MRDFFAMGGYGAFVWPAYLISTAVLGGVTFFVLRRFRRAREKLRELEKRPGDV